MRRHSMPLFQGLLWVTLLSGVPLGVTFAAAGNCAAPGSLPAVLESGLSL